MVWAMATRTVRQRIAGILTGSLGLVLIAVAVVIMVVRAYPLEAVTLSVVVVGGICWFKRWSAWRFQVECQRAEACADRQLERHRKTLISCFRQSIRPTRFGGEDTSLWQRHIATFLYSEVAPELSSASVPRSGDLDAHLAGYADAWVRSANARDRSGDQPIDPRRLIATEYEQYCASILSGGGWTVQPTPATGDRGADVIADRDGQRLVVQCKLCVQPVGNKAVQEVYSARSLYDGDHACVVAPNGFTAQAERDAYALGVRLLHHLDLKSFADGLCDWPSVSPRSLAASGRH
jgi:restriction system protein